MEHEKDNDVFSIWTKCFAGERSDHISPACYKMLEISHETEPEGFTLIYVPKSGSD